MSYQDVLVMIDVSWKSNDKINLKFESIKRDAHVLVVVRIL